MFLFYNELPWTIPCWTMSDLKGLILLVINSSISKEGASEISNFGTSLNDQYS